MNTIDTVHYKGIIIKIIYNQETFCFHAYSSICKSHNPYDSELKNFCYGFENPKLAVNDCKKRIDEWFSKSIKSYEELAEEITNTLTFTGDGASDCYLDVDTLKLILSKVSFTL